jgi:PPOX class probable F420-dependent enzyme
MAVGRRYFPRQLGGRHAGGVFPVRAESCLALTTSSGIGPPLGAVRERLENARVARLATIRPENRPHLVPVTFAVAPDGRLLTAVDAKPKKSLNLQRLRNIAAQPAVSLLVDDYDDDWSRLWWIRVDGEAIVLDDPVACAPLLPPLVARYPGYSDRPPVGPLIVITARSWTAWSAT